MLEGLLDDPKTPVTVRVSAISVALKMSGLAEKAAQKQLDNGKDERAMSLSELQAEIDKLSAEMDARTIEGGSVGVGVNAPGSVNAPGGINSHSPELPQYLDIIE